MKTTLFDSKDVTNWPKCFKQWPDEKGFQPRDMSWGFVDTQTGRKHVQQGDYIVEDNIGNAFVYTKEEHQQITFPSYNPYMVALCPTFRRPDCLRQTLWLWNRQSYPADRRILIIMDDGQTWQEQTGPNWILISKEQRYIHFPQKYQAMADLAMPFADAFVIWEDDDIYLPRYIECHADTLKTHEVSKSKYTMTNYPGYLTVERSDGRLFSSMGFRRSALEKINGFGDTMRADYDLQFISKLNHHFDFGNPWGETKSDIQFVYGWHTGHAHSCYSMKGPGDYSYYVNNEELFKPVKANKLEAKPMDWCVKIFEELGYSIN